MDVEALKAEAGVAACDYVLDGMNVGFGTGSTVKYTILELGRRVAEEGLNIVGVPTSIATRDLANEVGIPLAELDELDGLDVVIDGTDEFDPSFNSSKAVEPHSFEKKSWHRLRPGWWWWRTTENKLTRWVPSPSPSKSHRFSSHHDASHRIGARLRCRHA